METDINSTEDSTDSHSQTEDEAQKGKASEEDNIKKTHSQTEGEGTTDDKDSVNDEDNTDEVTVSIGDETPPSENDDRTAPVWVKQLRKNNRELKKQNRELEEKIKLNGITETQPVNPGKRPTLEDSDYDENAYEGKLTKWFESHHEFKNRESEAKSKQKTQQDQWEKSLADYESGKQNLKVSDYDEAEFAVQDLLSKTQQGMIVQGADNPATVIYALGKNPKKLEELSKISDPVKFAFAVAKLETKLKIHTLRRPTSTPEKSISGTVGNSGAVGSTLEKLRDEARKTGDFTKVVAYNKELKNRSG